MSDDEFDNIPDDFADIPNVDWTELLAGPSRPAETRLSHAVEPLAETGQISLLHEANDGTSSTHYFSDSDEMDASFFAELDCVEQRLTRTSEAPLTVIASGAEVVSPLEPQVLASHPGPGGNASLGQRHGNSAGTSFQLNVYRQSEERVSYYFANQTAGPSSSSKGLISGTSDANPGLASNVPSKRPHSEDSLIVPSPKRKGKMKADDSFSQILSLYEDELTCPICCDILAACHVGNPCGHSFCGECGWQWHVQKGNKGCPCCRGTLDERMPMVPNIAMDNTVEKHIKALALNGASEWEPNGQKCIDWDARKQAWRKGAAKRDAKKARQLPKPVALGAFQVFDLPPNWFEFQDGVEDDPTYEDSDVELIPRPIQRARRRRRRAGQIAADVG